MGEGVADDALSENKSPPPDPKVSIS